MIAGERSPKDGLDWVRRFADALDEMVWVWDAASGRVLHANAALLRLLGRESAAPVGRRLLLERVSQEDAAPLREAREHLPGTGYTLEYRLTQPARRGERARVARLREQAFASFGPNGERWVTHVARDISWQFDTTAQLHAEMSRRADAERSLSEANARLEAMLATANDPVISIDERSRVVDWNNAAERVFGWAREEAIGQVLSELIVPPAHREQHLAGIRRFLADGSAQIFNKRVETRAVRRSGEEFDVELSVWPVRTASGYTFSSFVRDISRRKAAARALAESEAKYRQVVENVNEGILVTAGGRILYSNPKALALTGQTLESAMSRPFIEFIHPDDRERVLGNHMRRLRGEAVENNYQFRVLHVDGRVRWLEISGVRFDWQGEAATLNFLVDVTERRQAEEDMRGALMRERELSELKSRFVAVASHEFRTPLAGILSSVELLDTYGARLPASERSEIVEQIRTAVTRMNGLVEQVLLTSKLESGHFTFEPRPLSVPQLLVQLAAEMDQALPQASRIAMRCDGLDESRLLDPRLLRHILMNLLSNALKYSAPDSAVECRVAAERDDGLLFSVSDRGIGIPAEDLPRLFETFHRGTNVGSIQGTGIGLHIVKECVDLHGGRIDVESESGRGTVFHVRLSAPRAAGH
ncbi:MAG TPA: PAS domain S-box protein [Ramlibacter sp.]|uniref:PAS domain S-box protein n=1 Tax=Ramlibacter sp. TaxID=1917967 RepID=UPI002D167285|nr:PAS domain S-box protein [Ramlibacter sp.]HVZ42574.1 PAS domain S-box protein [Ramlibacter sp.]